MKILVVIKRSPIQMFLVDLQTAGLVEEVARLIGKRRHSQAIATALSKGRFRKEVTDAELPNTKASFILSEENISWDLTK
ncbi:MAG: hypothetical protein WC592_07070 [Candidatus Omnitrophota bacterium]